MRLKPSRMPSDSNPRNCIFRAIPVLQFWTEHTFAQRFMNDSNTTELCSKPQGTVFGISKIFPHLKGRAGSRLLVVEEKGRITRHPTTVQKMITCPITVLVSFW